MKSAIYLISIAFSLAALTGTAQSQKPAATLPAAAEKPASAPAPAQSNARFARMCDEFVKDSLALTPATASQVGYHQHADAKTGKAIRLDAQLDDVSPEAMAVQVRFYRQWRQRFQSETPVSRLNAQDAADYRLIDDQIALNLLELETIQNYRHNPTVYVELIGNALFLPITQSYASEEARLGDVISRIGQIPRFLEQAKVELLDADPIFISTATDENAGNLDLLDTVAAEIPAGSGLKAEFDKAAPAARKALNGFDTWMKDDLAKRPTNGRTWRLGKEWYAPKFRYVMETSVTPEQLLSDAEAELTRLRAEMLEIALPLYKQMVPGQDEYAKLSIEERENKIIGAVLDKIGDEHPKPDQLMGTIKADVVNARQFIRDKKIVTLSDRDNLKVIPTPEFERGIYSVAGFHQAPALEPAAEAEYWVTPIDPKTSSAKVESKLREYNNYALEWLTLHEALPGHYVQFEHANDVQPPMRRVLRTLFSNGAYVEGWAEYGADVMTEAGWDNSSPKFKLVRKKIWLRAVANTILDIRLQTMGMTDQQALDLMTKQCFQTQAEADGKLVRAKLSSTQLPTYFLGTRQWWALRRKYEAAKGAGFTLEEFHDRALDQGPLPIEYLEKILLP
jgi:uncharacterized protein (DUF885 family)